MKQHIKPLPKTFKQIMFAKFFKTVKYLLFLFIIAIATTITIFYIYSKELPQYSQLTDYHPPLVTRIYSSDGKLMEEYANEHRIFVPITSIPRSLIEAFLAAEDKNFYSHQGVDLVSTSRAAITNTLSILKGKRLKGGSTITQQVVKNFLLTSERSLARKVKEAILSYKITKAFNKDQILELYLNQIFLGKSAYGVAAAALHYFDKSVEELDLAESAFLAALPKSPSNFDPSKYYDKARIRRNYVLSRMYEDGYIGKETALEAMKEKIILKHRSPLETVQADYYAERVRDEVVKMVGKDSFYNDGLTIITSLDSKMQESAIDALRFGIRQYDQKRGYRGRIAFIDLSKNLDWHKELLAVPKPVSLLEYDLAIILEVKDKEVKIGLKSNNESKILLSDMLWAKTNLKSAKDFLKNGDVVVVEAKKDSYALRQIPEVNGALMVMNNKGKVLAMQGGYDFAKSKFDRATQALRQPGSLSKSFVYLAALESGIAPSTIFDDAPISISQGAGMPNWNPRNYGGKFLGNITMRTGLEKSRNLITVRVAKTVGLSKVIEIIKRFGVNDNPRKFYSMVLGSVETTLERMTSAYAMIGGGGEQVTPHFIEFIKDRNGKVIYKRDHRPVQMLVSDEDLDAALPPILPELQTKRVTDEASNYQITSMLAGVVERGTAASAKKLGKIMAGKTGTTNDSKDTWFVGFTPLITVGTYIGYDAPKTLGKSATGSNVALPVYINFMEKAYKDIPSLAFKVPDSIKLKHIDQRSGHIVESGGIIEAFKVNSPERSDDDDIDIFDSAGSTDEIY